MNNGNKNSQVVMDNKHSSSSSSSSSYGNVNGFTNPYQNNENKDLMMRHKKSNKLEVLSNQTRQKQKDIGRYKDDNDREILTQMVRANMRYCQFPDGIYVIKPIRKQFTPKEEDFENFLIEFIKKCSSQNGGKVPNTRDALQWFQSYLNQKKKEIENRPPTGVYLDKPQYIEVEDIPPRLNDPREDLTSLCQIYMN